MLLNKPFQLGYLTNDLDKAVAAYRDRYGVGNFFTFDSGSMSEGRSSRVALAWTGQMMIEFIEPGADPLPHYRMDFTPGVFGLQHHHIGHLCESEAEWDQMLRDLDRYGFPVADDGRVPGVVRYLYADTRAVDGHYREYILLEGEGGRAFFDQVPQN